MFLERGVQNGRSKLEHGSEGVRVGGGEGVRGDVREDGGDEILVARERRHGKGKRKKRRRKEERENEAVTESPLTSSKTGKHVHESHMTRHQSHVTTQEHREDMVGSDGKRVEWKNDRERAAKVSASGGLEVSGVTVSAREDEREGEVPVPRHPRFLGTEECDFEMEPKHAVVDHLSPQVGRGEGEVYPRILP